MATPEGRAAVEQVNLSPAGRQAVQTGLRQTGRLTAELDVLRRQLGMLSRRQPGCRALRAAWFGIGPVTAVAIWAELGDVRRLGNSGNVVRHTGLDITVYPSDTKRAAGHLSGRARRCCWALYAPAKCAARPAAPDHGPSARGRLTIRGSEANVAETLDRRLSHYLVEEHQHIRKEPLDKRAGSTRDDPLAAVRTPHASYLPSASMDDRIVASCWLGGLMAVSRRWPACWMAVVRIIWPWTVLRSSRRIVSVWRSGCRRRRARRAQVPEQLRARASPDAASRCYTAWPAGRERCERHAPSCQRLP